MLIAKFANKCKRILLHKTKMLYNLFVNRRREYE